MYALFHDCSNRLTVWTKANMYGETANSLKELCSSAFDMQFWNLDEVTEKSEQQ
jgi:hypothetical protein